MLSMSRLTFLKLLLGMLVPAEGPVILTAAFMQVPVGRETLGRIMNVIGEPVDECGPIRASRTRPPGSWMSLYVVVLLFADASE